MPGASAVSLPDASRAFDGKDSTSRHGTRSLRCGISIQPMSQMGQSRSFGDVASMFELPLRAVVERTSVHGRKVPKPAVSRCSNDTQLATLFDHLVGAGEQAIGHREAERLRGLEVDHQLVLSRCLHWKVGGLFALQDAINIAGRTAPLNKQIGTVGNQAACDDEKAIAINGGQSTLCSTRDDDLAIPNYGRADRHDQTTV